MNTPVLHSYRLTFRPFRKGDVMSAYDLWYSRPTVAKYMFWDVHRDIEETKEWLAFEMDQRDKPDWYRFAIECSKSHQLIGSILLYYEKDVCDWEIAYHFAQVYWGKGFATEAVIRIIAFAREELHLTSVVARHAKENQASRRVLEKTGFQAEADIQYACNDVREVFPGILCRLRFKT